MGYPSQGWQMQPSYPGMPAGIGYQQGMMPMANGYMQHGHMQHGHMQMQPLPPPGFRPPGLMAPQQQPGPAAADQLGFHCLYRHSGEEVLQCSGAAPAFAVYQRTESVKLVVSLFNLECQVAPQPELKRIALRMQPHARKAGEAVVFGTAFNSSADKTTTSQLVLNCGRVFDYARIQVEQTGQRIKLIIPVLPQESVGGLRLTRVSGD
jgi:hypothetical protein